MRCARPLSLPWQCAWQYDRRILDLVCCSGHCQAPARLVVRLCAQRVTGRRANHPRRPLTARTTSSSAFVIRRRAPQERPPESEKRASAAQSRMSYVRSERPLVPIPRHRRACRSLPATCRQKQRGTWTYAIPLRTGLGFRKPESRIRRWSFWPHSRPCQRERSCRWPLRT
jgi:hypothetical protein